MCVRRIDTQNELLSYAFMVPDTELYPKGVDIGGGEDGTQVFCTGKWILGF